MQPAIMYIATSFHFSFSLSHFTLFHLTLDWLLEFFGICYEKFRSKYIEFGFGGIYVFWLTITFISSSFFSSCPSVVIVRRNCSVSDGVSPREGAEPEVTRGATF